MDVDAVHYLILNTSPLLFFLKNSVFGFVSVLLAQARNWSFIEAFWKAKIPDSHSNDPKSTDWYTSDSYKDQIRMKFIYIIRDIEVQIIVSY